MSWATLDELGVWTYMLSRSTKRQSTGPTTTSPGLMVQSNSHKSVRDKLGQLISGQGLPQILLETRQVAVSGEATREFLVFEAADITPIPDDATAGLFCTTLPEHVASRIREPLAFLPRRRLAYLDIDAWICTFQLSMRPILGGTQRIGSSSSSSLPSSGPTDPQSDRRLADTPNRRRASLQVTGAAMERVTAARRHGWESAASGKVSGIERHYFLPGDWAMANEARLYTMTPDGTLLCPQNGGIASVQSATLRK